MARHTEQQLEALEKKIRAWLDGSESLSYAGIGSRNTPLSYRPEIISFAKWVALNGGILETGGADGPDNWFEIGALLAAGILHASPKMNCHLPWPGFNQCPRDNAAYPALGDTEFLFAKQLLLDSGVCPFIDKLKQSIQRLFSRNVYQILKSDWSRVDLVVFYADEDYNKGTVSGGTRIAVYLARHLDIPCFNLKNQSDRELLYRLTGHGAYA